MTKIIKLTESELSKLIEKSIINEADKVEESLYTQYNKHLNSIYDQFQALEKEYNKFNLLELKNDYQLSNTIDKAKLLEEKFLTLEAKFKSQEDEFGDEDWYSDVDALFYKLWNLIDEFIGELNKLKDIFQEIGDLDKGSSYFRNPILH